MDKKYTQSQLTKIFLVQSNLSIAPSNLKYQIWYNPTNEKSLRLNLEGYRFVLQKLKYKSFEFQLPKPMTNKNLLQLERYFQTMYYLIKPDKIVVFDETDASMITLHGNDLSNYLDNLEINTI